MDNRQVIDLLAKKCLETSAAKFAESIGVSRQYIWFVLQGKRTPGPKILSGLGLAKAVQYEPTNGH